MAISNARCFAEKSTRKTSFRCLQAQKAQIRNCHFTTMGDVKRKRNNQQIRWTKSSDLGKCNLWSNISFSSMMPWFHKMSSTCKQWRVFPLCKKLEKRHHSLLQIHLSCYSLWSMKWCLVGKMFFPWPFPAK